MLSLLLLSFVFSTGVFAQEAESDTQDPNLAGIASDVPLEGKLTIYGLQLDGSRAEDALQLTRFNVWHPDSQVVVHGADDQITYLPQPDYAYFRGNLARFPQAKVYMKVDDRGNISGGIAHDGRYWLLGKDQGRDAALAFREVTEADLTNTPYQCGADDLEAVPNDANKAPGMPMEPLPKALAGGSYYAVIAAETDYEFYNRFAGAEEARDYIADLIAYTSVVYEAEFNTRLLVGEVSLWSTSADPWTATNTSGRLGEFRTYWNTNKGDVSRAIAHFFSGAGLGGGIAYVGVVCNSSYGYGVSGGLSGNFNINSPSSVWDIVVVSHELGHNFGSGHSHCYGGIGGNAEPVDKCYGSQEGCYSGSTSLPCGTSGAGCGTIMSYCHLLSGGLSNISLTLGLGHPHGIEPDRIPTRMSQHVTSVNGSKPSCLPQSCSGPTVSADQTVEEICVGDTLTLSVTAQNAADFQWYKDNNPIAGAYASTLTINNAQNSDAGSYTCTVTNACGSDTSSAVTVTLVPGVVISSQPEGTTICVGGDYQMSVSVSGSNLGYQWRRNGNNLSGQTSATLSLTNIQEADTGSYDCLIQSDCQTVTSDTAVISLDQVQISAAPQSTSLCEGESYNFSITVEGENLTYQWRRNGQDLPGETASTLAISNFSASQRGTYTCAVGNGCETVISAGATLGLIPAATITTQPVPQSACIGNIVNFQIAGTNISRYQWIRDGDWLIGETGPSLSFQLTSEDQLGNYYCRIWDDCGSSSSLAAALSLAGTGAVRIPGGNRAQGVNPVLLQALPQCMGNNLLWEWWDLNHGTLLSQQPNNLLLPYLDETTQVQVQVEDLDQSMIYNDSVTIFVPDSDRYSDPNGDGCNTIDDLWYMIDLWQTFRLDDPNGNNLIDVIDFLYTNWYDEDQCP